MLERLERDVAVLGGGPAGLAAARAAAEAGARVALVEREDRLGGILKQCVHDGFGLARFGERLTGPEYASREAASALAAGVEARTGSYVVEAARAGPGAGFVLRCLRRGGAYELAVRSLVLATGCRERTDRQVLIQGDRPAGILTAGLAQYMVNVQGLRPGRRAVILGSGDIGLIMARRLVLEGTEVEGVYEIKGEPSGLSRNVRQCLEDFGIPLHLSMTVTEVHGRDRVEGVTVAAADQRGAPIRGTERRVDCDTLVLSVGLIPENEVAASLGLELDALTRGPRVDQSGACLGEGLFCCGNALHVNDLADYVSESGEAAGRAAARQAARRAAGGSPERELLPLKAGTGALYAVPQFLDLSAGGRATIYFRSNATLREGGRLVLKAFPAGAGPASGGPPVELLAKSYRALRPPEMERVELELAKVPAGAASLCLEIARKE